MGDIESCIGALSCLKIPCGLHILVPTVDNCVSIKFWYHKEFNLPFINAIFVLQPYSMAANTITELPHETRVRNQLSQNLVMKSKVILMKSSVEFYSNYICSIDKNLMPPFWDFGKFNWLNIINKLEMFYSCFKIH